jgi:hypothetical protein
VPSLSDFSFKMRYDDSIHAKTHQYQSRYCRERKCLISIRFGKLLSATQVDCDGPKKYLADECNQYYECVEVKLLWFWSFWNPQLKNCPKGEAFDAVNEQCLPQELVQCHSTPVQTSVTTVDNGTPPVTTFMNLEIISEVNTKVSSLTSNDVIVTEGTDTTATDSIYSAEVTTNSREGTSTNIVPNFTGTHTSTSDIHPYSSTMSAVLITGKFNLQL